MYLIKQISVFRNEFEVFFLHSVSAFPLRSDGWGQDLFTSGPFHLIRPRRERFAFGDVDTTN